MVKACDAIRDKLFHAASAAADSPLAGRPVSDFALSDGAIAAGNAAMPLEQAFRQLGQSVIEEYAEFDPALDVAGIDGAPL